MNTRQEIVEELVAAAIMALEHLRSVGDGYCMTARVLQNAIERAKGEDE